MKMDLDSPDTTGVLEDTSLQDIIESMRTNGQALDNEKQEKLYQLDQRVRKQTQPLKRSTPDPQRAQEKENQPPSTSSDQSDPHHHLSPPSNQDGLCQYKTPRNSGTQNTNNTHAATLETGGANRGGCMMGQDNSISLAMQESRELGYQARPGSLKNVEVLDIGVGGGGRKGGDSPQALSDGRKRARTNPATASIDKYFRPAELATTSAANAKGTVTLGGSQLCSVGNSMHGVNLGGSGPWESQDGGKGADVSTSRKAAPQEVAQLHQQVAQLKSELEDSQKSTEEANNTSQQLRTLYKDLEKRTMDAIEKLAYQLASCERRYRSIHMQWEGARLGQMGAGLPVGRAEQREFGMDWQDGLAFMEVKEKLAQVQQQRELVEQTRKDVRKVKGTSPQRPDTPGQSAPGGYETPTLPSDEVLKNKLAALKRDEDALLKERDRLWQAKVAYAREAQLVQCERDSVFMREQRTLQGRYCLLGMLGRGGFSEVYKAYDLRNYKEVAVKVHQLSSTWSHAQKAHYVMHAKREYEIHRTLTHPNITRMLDVFEISDSAFATVLELCTGGDLENHLKMHQTLPEREARCIMQQVFSALVYLNQPHAHVPRVIHYDLKPANVLFTNVGSVKITDFGLSKVVEAGHTRGLELTSQGAGTYWYLPPECFGGQAGKPPMISNKVDVWSAGALLYQMLLGKKPFGDDQSQEEVLREGIILGAQNLDFPSKPAISQEARTFISRCLTFRQHDRPDVLTVAQDPFLAPKKSTKGQTMQA